MIHDRTIKTFDVTIFDDKHGRFTVDVKYPCGESLAGWCDLDTKKEAQKIAKNFIDEIPKLSKPHCDNHYCIEKFKKRNRVLWAENKRMPNIRDFRALVIGSITEDAPSEPHEKRAYVLDMITSEKLHANQPELTPEVCIDWLQGLCSTVEVLFYNHDILKWARSKVHHDFTDKQENKILEKYFEICGGALYQYLASTNLILDNGYISRGKK